MSCNISCLSLTFTKEFTVAAADNALMSAIDANTAADLSESIAGAEADANIQADVDSNEAAADASFAAMKSVQTIDGSIAHDGSAIVFVASAGSELQMGGGTVGESVKVKSKVADGDITISGDIEGMMASSVTVSDNGAVTLVCDGAMWWIM